MLEDELEIPSLEYLAGLFDGEGSIFITKMKMGRDYHQLRVGVNITHEPTPRLFHTLFGGNLGIIPSKNNSKQQWYWRASGKKALEFLTTIYPYLIIKKGQAELGIKFQKRQTKWFKDDNDANLNKVESELMAILNQRGVCPC